MNAQRKKWIWRGFLAACLLVLFWGYYTRHPDDWAADQIESYGGEIRRHNRPIFLDILGEELLPYGAVWVVDYEDQPVTEEMMIPLTRLRSLEDLAFAKCRPIAPSAFGYLNRVTIYRALIIIDSDVTDEHMKHLKHLSKPIKVFLMDIPITDASIPILGEMKDLRLLALHDTGVSKAGFEELQRRLPNTCIRYSNGDVELTHGCGQPNPPQQ